MFVALAYRIVGYVRAHEPSAQMSVQKCPQSPLTRADQTAPLPRPCRTPDRRIRSPICIALMMTRRDVSSGGPASRIGLETAAILGLPLRQRRASRPADRRTALRYVGVRQPINQDRIADLVVRLAAQRRKLASRLSLSADSNILHMSCHSFSGAKVSMRSRPSGDVDKCPIDVRILLQGSQPQFVPVHSTGQASGSRRRAAPWH